MNGIIHIAGLQVQVGPRLRQRCSWCGAMLLEYDLTAVAVPEGQEPGLPTWEPGILVEVDGNVSLIVPHKNGDDLPQRACGWIDPAVTS